MVRRIPRRITETSLSITHLEKTPNPVPKTLVVERLLAKLPSVLSRLLPHLGYQLPVEIQLLLTLTLLQAQLKTTPSCSFVPARPTAEIPTTQTAL